MDKVNRVFVSGLEYKESVFKTSGGRVLCTQALGNTVEDARKKAYDDLNNINFSGMYYRIDIGIID